MTDRLPAPRSLTWPTFERLATGTVGLLIGALVFFPIYIGCAALTEARGNALHLYAQWELAIPFWPFMIVPYLSMFVLFLMPPLQLDAFELRALVRRLLVASLIGGIVFLVLPAQLGFAERTDAGIWQGVYDTIYRLDNRYNTVPSFHVIYTASILLAFMAVATAPLRRIYLAWLVIVCASTVLTHRHHLADVAAGLAIAVGVRAVFPRPLPSLSTEPT
ncbi:MAG TPA: phosphatase PAP2 family protein [Xanthobacteraceae bacterium]|nr:phosphatase PAP2 family protein [Xanthobacteraceae bacterium]